MFPVGPTAGSVGQIHLKANLKREATESPEGHDVDWGRERDELRVSLGCLSPREQCRA